MFLIKTTIDSYCFLVASIHADQNILRSPPLVLTTIAVVSGVVLLYLGGCPQSPVTCASTEDEDDGDLDIL